MAFLALFRCGPSKAAREEMKYIFLNLQVTYVLDTEKCVETKLQGSMSSIVSLANLLLLLL